MLTRVELEDFFQIWLNESGGDLREIVWHTMDGRKIKLKDMSYKHLQNSLSYFRDAIHRLKDQIELTQKEIEDNWDRPDRDDFEALVDRLEKQVEDGQRTLYVLQKENERRKQQEKEDLKKNPKLARMRARIKERELQHMNAVRSR